MRDRAQGLGRTVGHVMTGEDATVIQIWPSTEGQNVGTDTWENGWPGYHWRDMPSFEKKVQLHQHFQFLPGTILLVQFATEWAICSLGGGA